MLKNYAKMLKAEFSGYNASRLVKDLLAGLTVAAVALPLALAFGVASGADAAAGLITAIIAGVVISALSGASFQISGPTGAMSAILITIVAKYKLQGVFTVCFIAGVILLVCGIFKLGKLVSLIPRPVITGFTSGIAIIIALGQVDNFFGTHSEGETAIAKLASYASLGFKPHWFTLLIGAIVVLIMLVYPKKWNSKVPSSLVGIIIATVVYAIFRFDGVATVGEIPRTLFPETRFSLSALDFSSLGQLLPSAVTVAALAMIESLLCGASASRMKNEPFDADIELTAQGIGNILIPFFGGVPATAAIARTSVAIKSGAQTRLTGIFHAMWLLAVMFLLGDIMKLIPLSALAGVLIVTAWRMNEWHEIRYIFSKKFYGAILKFLITMLATVVFDLTIAIVVGVVFSILVFVKNSVNLSVSFSEIDHSRMADKAGEIDSAHSSACVAYVTGAVFFANTNALLNTVRENLEKYPECDEIIFSLRGVPSIDTTGIQAMRELYEELCSKKIKVLFCGINEQTMAVFVKSGLYDTVGKDRFFFSVDKALLNIVK